MKLTSNMLRQLIKEEMSSPEKAPQPRNLSAAELRHIIVTEAAKLTSAQLLSEDIATLQGIVDDKVILRRPTVGGRKPKADAEVDDEAPPRHEAPAPMKRRRFKPRRAMKKTKGHKGKKPMKAKGHKGKK